MSWLVSKLKERIQIKLGVQTPTDDGGLSISYIPILTVWAGVRPLTYGKYIRGVQVGLTATHEIIFRKVALSDILTSVFGGGFGGTDFPVYTGGFGREFNQAFSEDFDVIADLNPLKSDFFLFLEKGSNVKGMLFKIEGSYDDEEEDEFFHVLVTEVQEKGTGYAV